MKESRDWWLGVGGGGEVVEVGSVVEIMVERFELLWGKNRNGGI